MGTHMVSDEASGTALQDAAPSSPHVVVVPFPAQGHLNPCLSLAHFLASSGVSLTLVQTTHALTGAPRTAAANGSHNNILAAAAPASPFRTEIIPGGFDRSTTLSLPNFVSALDLMRKDVTALLHRLMLEENAPVCLLLDAYLPWGDSVAAQFGLSRVALYTSAASLCCLGCHLLDIAARGFLPATDEGAEDKIVDFIPGLSPFRVADIPRHMAAEEGLQSDRFVFFTSVYQRLKSADRILVNTMYELEGSAIDALRKDRMHIDPVGPLFMMSNMEPQVSQVLGDSDDDASLMSWLEQQQEEDSVLYIAFGSLAAMQEEVLAEIAHGLEASGERFVWVVRLDEAARAAANMSGADVVEEILPQGFVERTRGRGRVISWAPQLSVLGHHCVGAFLTHCGWNSVLESLSNGVPMLGFPQMAEQNINLKLMVHDWKVALAMPLVISADIRRQQQQQPKVERSRVQSAITAIMRGVEGTQVRMRAREWKEVARRASQGSSKHNLQKLVHDLKHGLLSVKPPH